jgi:hypothetical protein
MSNQELELYATSGTLPSWFEQTVGAVQAEQSEQEEYTG